MKADQIISLCEASLLEGPETPEAAVRGVKRMALKLTIDELESKAAGFLKTANRMSKELEKIEEEARGELAESEIDF